MFESKLIFELKLYLNFKLYSNRDLYSDLNLYSNRNNSFAIPPKQILCAAVSRLFLYPYPFRYIREHKKAFYTSLLTSGKLQSYLADVEEQAQELFDRLMKQLAEREGVTEWLKADNHMEWIKKMSNIQARAREIVNAELIFS